MLQKTRPLQAQVTLLMAYYGLLIDAHLIWYLAHDLYIYQPTEMYLTVIFK